MMRGRDGRRAEEGIVIKTSLNRETDRERETGSDSDPSETYSLLKHDKHCFPYRMDLRGLKGISAYITIHNERLLGLPHRASSYQSVIVSLIPC